MYYEDTMSRAKNCMTTDHDDAFKAAQARGLKWWPWVGANYDKSAAKIFVVGASTYYKEGEETDDIWVDCCNNSHNPNRVLVMGNGIETDTKKGCFANTAMMFLDGAKKPYDLNARKMFWESVAFANFVQEIVPAGTQVWDVGPNLLTRSRMALYAVADIIKPKLILVWGVTTVGEIYVTNRRYGENKINKAYPRIIDGVFDLPNNPPPIIGMAHPSAHFSRDKWLDFLLEESASKETVGRFIKYLKQPPD